MAHRGKTLVQIEIAVHLLQNAQRHFQLEVLRLLRQSLFVERKTIFASPCIFDAISVIVYQS